MTLLAPVPALMLLTCSEVGGKLSYPSSQRLRRQRGERGHRLVDGVARLVRIRHVALDAAHREGGRQRAAPADPQQVAQCMLRRRLAGDAPVDALAAFAEHIGDLAHAVDRIAFLVRGQQQGDLARMPRMRGHERFQRDHERRHAALHVRRAAPVQHAVADLRCERIAGPGLTRTGRHHVGMAEQHQHRAVAVAMRRPQIVDLAEAQRFDAEAGALQAFADQALAAGIVRGDRSSRDQVDRELQDVAHCHPHPSPLPPAGEGVNCGYRTAS
jgi:hypothetical protein